MKLDECKNQKYDIIILAGQSNAEGTGLGDVKQEFVPDERIHSLSDQAIYRFEKDENGKDYLYFKAGEYCVDLLKERVSEGKTYASLAPTFAKKYIEDNKLEKDRKLLVITAGVGGTGFYRPEWGVGNVLFNRLVDLTKAALSLNSENRIVAFLWHQGEHDAYEGREYSYLKKRRCHYYNLRYQTQTFFDIFNIKVPFIAGKFCQEWYVKEIGDNISILNAIEDVVADLGGEIVETEDLLSNNQILNNGDDVHFCRQSQYILGERYYEAYKKCLNKNK